MALTRTAAQLVSDVRNRSDHLVGSFRSNAALRRYLSESCRSLVTQLVEEYGELYWASEATVTTAADTQTSSLPADCFKVIMFRATVGGTRKGLKKAQIDHVDSEAQSAGGWSCHPRYRLMGRRIYWYPIPHAEHAVTLFYVPTTIFFDEDGNPIDEFADDTDYFDGVFGWEQVVVLDAAIKLLNDEKKDPVPLMQERVDRWTEIVTAAANQDATEPTRVRDTWRGGSAYDDDYYRRVDE